MVILAIIGLTGLCSSNSTTSRNDLTDSSVGTAVAGEPTNTMPAVPPPAPQPFNLASARLGFRHFKLAVADEGVTGAMVYSQNCYDALNRTFSWSKLDVCGAFDMEAVQRFQDDADVSSDQSNYFAPETAAGRYLAAATGAGEAPAEADHRLAAVQYQVPKLSKISQSAHAAQADASAVEDTSPDATPVAQQPASNTAMPNDLLNVSSNLLN